MPSTSYPFVYLNSTSTISVTIYFLETALSNTMIEILTGQPEVAGSCGKVNFLLVFFFPKSKHFILCLSFLIICIIADVDSNDFTNKSKNKRTVSWYEEEKKKQQFFRLRNVACGIHSCHFLHYSSYKEFSANSYSIKKTFLGRVHPSVVIKFWDRPLLFIQIHFILRGSSDIFYSAWCGVICL